MDDAFSAAGVREIVDRLVHEVKPEYFVSKRWFGSKGRTIRGYRMIDFALLQGAPDPLGVLLLEITYAEADPELYQLPLAFRAAERVPAAIKDQPEGAAVVAPTPDGDIWAYDAFVDDAFCVALYRSMSDDATLEAEDGAIASRHIPGRMEVSDVCSIRRISTEQSNTSIVYNDRLIFKAFRKLAAGRNPDFDVPYYLTTHTDFQYVPKVAGYIEYQPRQPEAQAISLAVLQDFVPNQGDGYTNALNRVRAFFAAVLPLIEGQARYTEQERAEQASRCAGDTPREVRRLGYITGLMHNALASHTDLPDFRPEPVTGRDTERWEANIAGLIEQVIGGARAGMDDMPADHRDTLRPVVDHEPAFLDMVPGLSVLVREGCHKTRCHNDYHLGQVLKIGDDFMILDFEGEPARGLAERQAKYCPLRDVAGMLRSLDYAAYAVLFEVWAERQADEAERSELERWALAWEKAARDAFLEGYCDSTSRHTGPRFMPADPAAFRQVVKILEVEKAFYELKYEFNNRPTWIPVPARGLLRLLRGEG